MFLLVWGQFKSLSPRDRSEMSPRWQFSNHRSWTTLGVPMEYFSDSQGIDSYRKNANFARNCIPTGSR
jgi:hypothetical protein